MSTEALALQPAAAQSAVSPLLVIGAGRAALAFVSRLPAERLRGVVVADPSAGWLDAWASRLRRCGASHVRAPHTSVPLPAPLAVKSYAERKRRAAELAASSPRFVAVPTLALYADACADALGRMPAARTRVLRAQVTRLSMLDEAEQQALQLPAGGMRAYFADGSSLVAAQVVYTTAYRTPAVPDAFARFIADGGDATADVEVDTVDTTALQPPPGKVALSRDVDVRTAAVRGQTVCIVGSGMTAASMALAALRGGAASVTWLCRAPLRRREAEVGPEWAGAKALRDFQATTEAVERLRAVRSARGGATLNGHTWAAVRAALRAGAPLDIREGATVERARWDGAQWDLEVRERPDGTASVDDAAAVKRPATPPQGDAAPEGAADDDEPMAGGGGGRSGTAALVADVVWLACGAVADVRADPLLQALRREAPARVLGGLPVLEPGLRWPGAPLFILGEYAALSLGPAAGAPPGHRLGAEAAVASTAEAAAAAAAGERPYDCAAGALPLDMLYDDEELAAPHAQLPCRGVAPRPPLPGGALIDVSDLDASLPRRNLDGYAWADSAEGTEGDPDAALAAFTLEVSVQVPEAVTRAAVRVAFTPDAAEMWAVCAGGAYRLHLPHLYRRIVPERCTFGVAPRSRRVTLRLYKAESTLWRHLKAM